MSGTAVHKFRWPAWLPWLALLLAMAGCASLPKDYPRSVSHVIADTGATRLGRLAASMRAGQPDSAGVHLLARGLDAFAARRMRERRSSGSAVTASWMAEAMSSTS